MALPISPLKVVGIATHMIVAVASIAMGVVAGADVLFAGRGVTYAGFLVSLTVLLHLLGATVFAVYQPTAFKRTTLLATEVAIVAGSLYWLAVDLCVAAIVTMTMALALANRPETAAASAD